MDGCRKRYRTKNPASNLPTSAARQNAPSSTTDLSSSFPSEQQSFSVPQLPMPGYYESSRSYIPTGYMSNSPWTSDPHSGRVRNTMEFGMSDAQHRGPWHISYYFLRFFMLYSVFYRFSLSGWFLSLFKANDYRLVGGVYSAFFTLLETGQDFLEGLTTLQSP